MDLCRLYLVNPSNSALLSIICKDPSISNTAPNQWGICYEEIVISSNKETAEFESEFENVQISTTGAEKKLCLTL
jgi:hypothetical protein